MVNLGGFSVKLIHPHSKQPYKEHRNNNDGKYYCEVEPGADYLIQFEVLDMPDSDHVSKNTLVYVQFDVDGINLGYYETLKAGDGPQEACYYEYTNGVENETALRFERPRRRAVGTDTTAMTSSSLGTAAVDEVESPEASWAGNVSVSFSEAILVGKRQRNENWSSEKVEAVVTGFPGEGAFCKVVRSGQGSWSQSLDVQEVEEELHYEAGKTLQTLTIHYCTCLGLIHRGILDRPPFWEMARLQAPCKQIESAANAVLPKRIKLEPITNSDGRVIKQGEQYDYFDLTEVDDDVEEEEGQDNNGNQKNPMDLTGILNGGIIPQPDGVEKLVDRFFIMNFHGKSYGSFHKAYRRKDALAQSATNQTNESCPDFCKVVERHKRWEKEINNAYGTPGGEFRN